jgi:hypothetical protein
VKGKANMKTFKYVLFALLLSVVYEAGKARAQISAATVSYDAVQSAAVSAGCPAPTLGFTIYCRAADKFEVSANGGPYVVIWPNPIVAGVTSISVNGGTPMTAAVVLTIPTKATSTTTTAIQ